MVETASWIPPDEISGPAPGLQFAGSGARFGAYILDVLILLAVLLVGALLGAGPAAVGLTGETTNAFALTFALLMWLLLLAYFPFFWARGGATPGMKLLGLRVVRDRDGAPISLGQAILRLIGFWVSSFFFYIGFIWILIDKRKRGWHDLIAGTVVVRNA